MNAIELNHMNGHSVLVRSNSDHSDPPIALRGTIAAKPNPAGKPDVKIVLEFPDMCNRAAHQGVMRLNEVDAEHLLASEHDGIFEYTIDGPLDPPGPEPWTPQAVS